MKIRVFAVRMKGHRLFVVEVLNIRDELARRELRPARTLLPTSVAKLGASLKPFCFRESIGPAR